MCHARIHRRSKDESSNRKRKIRILLVDDHPSVLEGLRSYLRSRRDLRVVGQALDGEEAVTKAALIKPDVLIVDLSLPSIGGLEVMRRVRDIIPCSKFIIYSMHNSRVFIQEALSMGADGFVSKGSSLRHLVRTIERVCRGKNWENPKTEGTWGEATSGNPKRTLSARVLTDKEIQVLRALADGFKLIEIAELHNISFHTVVSHLRNIYDKLGVRNRSSAVALARARFLI